MTGPDELHGATWRMSSREFQARTGRDVRAARQRERRAALLGANGRVRAEHTKHRACPACGEDAPRTALVAGGSAHGRCPGCGLLYVPDVVTRAARDLLRPPPEEVGEAIYLSPLQREFDAPKFRRGVELLRAHAPAGAPVLDVGTASGLFLEVLREEGLDGVGLELPGTPYEPRHAELGLVVEYGAYEDAPLAAGSFGAVCFWDCLEHLEDPLGALRRADELLVPGGVVLALVPNAGSLAARVMHGRCAMFDGVEHVNLWEPATLRDLARRADREVVSLETLIPELNVLNNHLAYEDPYLGASDERDALEVLPEVDAAALLARDLGYKILAVLAAGG